MKEKIKLEHGTMFGKLMVICDAKTDKFNKSSSWVICSCGKSRIKIISNRRLKIGDTKSCGCLKKELMTKHGFSRTPEYHTYCAMLRRCTNKRDNAFKHYGGRGIKVCERWLNSFENFYKDMGKRPYKKSIDRIDNNGNYSPENCRWATKKEQSSNRRNNILIKYKDKTVTLAELARIMEISLSTLYYRYKRGQNLFAEVRKQKKVT